MKIENKNEVYEMDIQLLRIYQRNMELLIKTTKFFNDTEGKSIHPLSHILLEKVADGCWNYLTALKKENNGSSFNQFMKAKNSISEAIPVIDLLIDKTPELNENLNEIMDRIDMLIKMINWSLNKLRTSMGRLAA